METDLYPPIKRHLERLGLEVKGEVCGSDLVALSEGSPELVVIGESHTSSQADVRSTALRTKTSHASDWKLRPTTKEWL